MYMYVTVVIAGVPEADHIRNVKLYKNSVFMERNKTHILKVAILQHMHYSISTPPRASREKHLLALLLLVVKGWN